MTYCEQIKPEEMKVIIESFQNSAHVLAEGFRVDGEKFTVINSNDRSLWAKKESFAHPGSTLSNEPLKTDLP